MTYLVVNDVEDRGVYAFESRGVAEKIGQNFKNYVFMHDDEKDRALSLAGVSEITDALFLIRKYNSKSNKPKKEDKEKKPSAQDKNTVNDDDKKMVDHHFVKVFNKMKESGIGIKISLVNGNEYIVSTKSYFLKMTSCTHQNFLSIVDGEVRVNDVVVGDAIKNGMISVLPKTKVEYVGNYMILNGCDDKYSPNYIAEPNSHYEHQYKQVAINMDQIVDVSVADEFDFGANEILRAEVLVKYLVRRML